MLNEKAHETHHPQDMGEIGCIQVAGPVAPPMKRAFTHRPSASFVMFVVPQEKCSMKMLSGKCSGALGGWGAELLCTYSSARTYMRSSLR